MRKNVIIILITILLTYTIYSHAFVIALVNGVARATVPTLFQKIGQVPLRAAIPAIVGSSLLFLKFDGLQTTYNEPSASNFNNNYSNTKMPQRIEQEGVLYEKRHSFTNQSKGSSYIIYYPNGEAGCSGAPTIIIYSNCVNNSCTKTWYCKISQTATSPQQSYSAPSIVNETDDSTTILPFQLNLSQSVNENVNNIKNALQAAGYSSSIVDSITKEDVLPLLATFPPSLYNPPTNTTLENIELQKARDNMTSQIYEQSQSIPLTDDKKAVEVKLKEDNLTTPILDNNIDLTTPEFSPILGDMTNKDFLEPVRNFFDNFLNSLPFITLIRSTNIETSSIQSKVTFTIFSRSIEFDFASYSTVYDFMSRVIVFAASIFAILIIIA